MNMLMETLPEFSTEDAIDAILTVWDSSVDDHIDGVLIRSLADSIVVGEDRSLDFRFIDGCNYHFSLVSDEEPDDPMAMSIGGGSRVMTLEKRERVKEMRLAGLGYKKIAQEIGVSRSTVKTYCFRHGLAGKGEELAKAAGNLCRNCGTPVVQTPKRKKKLYCSDQCRYAYWQKAKKQQ